MTAWLTVDDLRAEVRNTKATGAEDAALQLSVEVGVGKVEELCGPIVETSVVERVSGSGTALVLSFRAASLVEVASTSGTVLTLADFYADGQLLKRDDDGRISGPLNVTYLSGEATAPAWAKSAALDIAAQDWRSRLAMPGQQQPVPSGFLVPNKAAEKMKDHLLAPLGFA